MSTLVFVGDGPLTQANAIALLNDYVGITGETEEGFPIWGTDERPALYYLFTRDTVKGFGAALDWSEYAELPFTAFIAEGMEGSTWVQQVTEAADVVLVDDLNRLIDQHVPKDAVFMVLLDEIRVPSEHAAIQYALDGGYTVLDLSAGLYTLTPGTAKPPEPEQNPGVADPTPNNDEAQTFAEADDEAQQVLHVFEHDYSKSSVPMLSHDQETVTNTAILNYLQEMEGRIIDAINAAKLYGRYRD